MNNTLVIGSGGREHAICWRMKQSPSAGKIFCTPGNAGIAEEAVCIELKTEAEIIDFCKRSDIALVVIGPEQPLVEGLSDALAAANIPVFGPSKKAAQLEASKGYMKHICSKYNIPTAAYGYFIDETSARKFLEGKSYPLVIKADGLAAGKGVVIAEHENEARETLSGMFAGQFGAAGKTVVIEEFLEGEEVSFFALSDGNTVLEFGYAQDHKRAYDGDSGPNTGGMGTYSPPPIMTAALRKQVMEEIIIPTANGMKAEGAPFKGVLFAGLMLTKSGPKLLEYNVRFGDPETQSLIMRFDGDLFTLLHHCATGKLSAGDISFSKQAALCVVMAAKGYPAAYAKGSVIKGLDKAGAMPNTKIFHAGTQARDGNIVSVGGRVLGVTALGATIKDAQTNAYKAVGVIDWPEGFFRRDIGWRGINKP